MDRPTDARPQEVIARRLAMTEVVVVPDDFAEGTLPRKALEKYIQWMNLWMAYDRVKFNDPTGFPDLTIQDFFKYDETTVVGKIEFHWYHERQVLLLSAGYGDEGGAALLHVSCDGDAVDHIVQEFDTYYSVIYDNNQELVEPSDGGFLTTPKTQEEEHDTASA